MKTMLIAAFAMMLAGQASADPMHAGRTKAIRRGVANAFNGTKELQAKYGTLDPNRVRFRAHTIKLTPPLSRALFGRAEKGNAVIAEWWGLASGKSFMCMPPVKVPVFGKAVALTPASGGGKQTSVEQRFFKAWPLYESR